jgi:hypothetical protein
VASSFGFSPAFHGNASGRYIIFFATQYSLCGAPHKLYSEDPRDLSRAPTLEDFLRRYGQFFRNCAGVLNPGGKLCVLMGDYHDRQAGFIPLVYHSKRLAFAASLRQSGTDIIRFLHGTSSSRKVYPTSFIPTMHDVCMIFEKQS